MAKPIGRPAWKPSEEEIRQINLYASAGCTQEQVATLIGKSVDTICRHEAAKEAFERGKAQTIAKVGGSLVRKALSGDTASAIFYLKTQAGWKEVSRTEHTGADGGPISLEASDEELLRIAQGKS